MKRIYCISLVIFLIILNTSLSFMKTKVETPSASTEGLKGKATSSKEIFGFATYHYPGDKSSYNSIITNAGMINDIATETYVTNGVGKLAGVAPYIQVSYANSKVIKTYAMITNNFDGKIAKELLESSINRQNLINDSLNKLKENGYEGVNIDLEGVFYYDREYLNTFIKEIYIALHSKGYTVTLSIPGKTYDNYKDGWSGAFDYSVLGANCDKVVIMTYDEHYSGGSPGPIASIGWVNNVVNYAITLIPKSKLLLGTAAYGYDWSVLGTKALKIEAAQSLAASLGVSIQWDDKAKSSYYTYKDLDNISHTVWFEDGRSLSYKLDLVNNKDLLGIAIWRLGTENKDYWTSIKTKFDIKQK
ncbi:MAG TPA: glycosyl hydrolase family 18 protein [Clostridiaceae bacterium]